MKKSLLLAGALALCTPLFAEEAVPAFPGAEGHGEEGGAERERACQE